MSIRIAADRVPDSIERQHTECQARNMDFTFDSEKVCGIKLAVVSSAVPEEITATAISNSDEGSAATSFLQEAPATAVASPASTQSSASKPSSPISSVKAPSAVSTLDSTSKVASTGTSTTSPTGTAAAPSNSAPQARAVLSGMGIAIAASAMMLW